MKFFKNWFTQSVRQRLEYHPYAVGFYVDPEHRTFVSLRVPRQDNKTRFVRFVRFEDDNWIFKPLAVQLARCRVFAKVNYAFVLKHGQQNRNHRANDHPLQISVHNTPHKKGAGENFNRPFRRN